MKKIYFLFLFPTLGISQNLVPNPSFEDTIACPTSISQITYANGWSSASQGTPDYYNACNNPGIVGVPINPNGTQNARTGVAYAGVVTYMVCCPNGREYIQIQLTDTLEAGSQYEVKFYVNLIDNGNFATKKLGAYLSPIQLSIPGTGVLPYVPQVLYSGPLSLSSKTNWMEIKDTIIATGNEQYIIIGNFFADTLSGLTTTTATNPCACAYYNIDDVSVILISGVGIDENETNTFLTLSPNPTSGIFNLQSEAEIKEIEIYNSIGERVYYQQISKLVVSGVEPSNLQINLSQPKGIYFIRAVTDKGTVTGKVVVE